MANTTSREGRDLTIVAARVGDLKAVAALQIASWQRTYRGLVADRFLEDEVPVRVRQRWSAAPGPSWRVETIWDGTTLVGFVAVDLAHHGGPYVDNLHVAHPAKGQGAGRRLMATAARHAAPYGQLWLTVMVGNEAALDFYKRVGGALGPRQEDDVFGTKVLAIPVHWSGSALEALATSERSPSAASGGSKHSARSAPS